MASRILKAGLLGLVAAVFVSAPAQLVAQTDTNTTAAPATTTPPADTSAPPVLEQPAATNAPVKAKKSAKKKVAGEHSSKGSLAAVDNVNKTITVGKNTFQITSQTLIYKDGNFGILADGTVGETAQVSYKKNADGSMSAMTVHFGTKAAAKAKTTKVKKSKNKPATEDSGTSTNQPAGGTAM